MRAQLSARDAHLHHLILLDPTPVEEPILDFCLARIAEARESQSIQDWIRTLGTHGARLRSLAIDRLLGRGIGVGRGGRGSGVGFGFGVGSGAGSGAGVGVGSGRATGTGTTAGVTVGTSAFHVTSDDLIWP